MDQTQTDKHSYLVDASAIYLCRFMMRDVKFLQFKPSEVAVAAFMLALNANLDTPLSKALDVELLEQEHINVESYFQDTTIRIRINGQNQLSHNQSLTFSPLSGSKSKQVEVDGE